jgi:hypothetical protein
MSRDQHPGERDGEPDVDEYYDEGPRSIFSALWFRALLALLVLGVIAAVGVPYMLDLATHSASDSSAAKRPPVAAKPPDVKPETAKPQTPEPTATPAPASSAAVASTTGPPGTAAPVPTTSSSISTPVEPAKTPDATPATAQPARKVATAKPATVVTQSREMTTERSRVVSTNMPSAVATTNGTSSTGPYWVQVAAFKDAEAAKRMMSQLRSQGFRVEQTTTEKSVAAAVAPTPVAAAPSGGAGDRYIVVVTGAPGDLDAKLAAKGMTSEATSGGIAVRPTLPLREAVVLSRELADAGLTVQVRRQGAPAATSAPAVSAPAPSTPARGTDTWYRVRVGGFPDRATALASLKKLEEKGYKPFIGTGTN